MDPALSDFELQQELQRFTTQFIDRVTQATEILERSAHPAVRDEALRKNLLYVSGAMEIATGPFSEVNLLDMIVFARFCRAALERHWVPKVYGQDGRDLIDVFSRAEQDLSGLAEQALTAEQRQQLSSLVDAWLAENPDQVRVEGIRLSDFSAMAGSAAAERALQARGLLSSVKVATRAANLALALTDRGMFLLHRLPFLWRLQARLGARELLGDAGWQVKHALRRGVVYAGLLGGAGVFAWWMRTALRK
jgi:hypothetical protein